MNHWPFIIAAYGVTLVGAGGLLTWSLMAMRKAEAAAERGTGRKDAGRKGGGA